ncbi:MLO-like protein 13 isoform X3 [Phalaenopsis equestris]|uniref:MLO-like protein 13 isoform X3 n=1 Tax=Phalaenopsis equestris TaxID=78828 RepID=UPI0009E206CF|nr:MLO-like protein 13 isoform X3 [Phalaenopsis equestris]
MASIEDSETLEYTATWVVALVCTIIVVVSLLAERFLHYLGKFLKHEHQDALFRALEKLKEELMLLGFISLLLTVSQSFISDICIPRSASFHMLPCIKEEYASVEVIHYRAPSEITWKRQRLLAGDVASNHCTRQGKVQLLSLEALHQLHIFIFVLAVAHVVFSATTMVLGGARIRQWQHWEKEIHREISSTEKFSCSDSHQRFSQPHHEFVQERAAGFWRKSAVVSRMMSFFKQFYGSFTKSDYKALRAGFIMRHCPTHSKFNFHKYMMRALEDDFKKVVGISWYLWLFVIIFLLINIHGWHAYFWLSFLPLIMGDSYKQAIFAEHMQTTLHGWVAGVRKRKRSGSVLSSSIMRILGRKKKMKKQEEAYQGEVQMQMMMRSEDSGHLHELPASEIEACHIEPV